MTKWSNSELDVGYLSAKWPQESGLSYWQALHDSVGTLRDLMTMLNGKFEGIDQDANLSPTGKKNSRTAMARQALEELREFAPLTKASNTVARRIANLKEKLTALPGATSPAELHIASEIRAAIKSSKSPEQFAYGLKGDAKVMASVLSAPAFLSGLTDEAAGRLRETALQTLHPAEVAEIAALESAEQHAKQAVAVASERIAQRAGLQKNMAGEYTSE